VDTPPFPNASPAAAKFIASMKMNYEMWHDGTGYDLEALRQVPPAEREVIAAILIKNSPRDWRDIEALGHIDSDAARHAVEAALKSSDPAVRREAMNYAGEKSVPADRQALLIANLGKNDFGGGLTAAIDEAAEFHPPAVVDVLLKGALNRDGQVAVHFAALLYFIHGKSTEPFDWNQRPFFLRFNTANREERKEVFAELCQTIGVDASAYIR